MNAPNATVERILDAAETRIKLTGYNAVSFRELVDAVSVKSPSVHYHFPAKADLGVALVKRYHERFFEALAANTASPRRGRSFARSPPSIGKR